MPPCGQQRSRTAIRHDLDIICAVLECTTVVLLFQEPEEAAARCPKPEPQAAT